MHITIVYIHTYPGTKLQECTAMCIYVHNKPEASLDTCYAPAHTYMNIHRTYVKYYRPGLSPQLTSASYPGKFASANKYT